MHRTEERQVSSTVTSLYGFRRSVVLTVGSAVIIETVSMAYAVSKCKENAHLTSLATAKPDSIVSNRFLGYSFTFGNPSLRSVAASLAAMVHLCVE